MARACTTNRSLGCRLVLLLLWTIVVSSILYATHENAASDSSTQHRKELSFTRRKRSPNTLQPDQNQCTLDSPTQENIKVLTKMFSTRKTRSGKPVVHCSVVSACNKDTFQAYCYSNVCSAYEVFIKEGSHVLPSLSGKELSDIVGASLRDNSFMTVSDLNRYMDIRCQDDTGLQLELTGDIMPNPNCPDKQSRALDEGKRRQKTLRENIHILYFRYLSHWELPVRFPGLLSLLEQAAVEDRVSVLTLDKQQASKWGDHEVLSLLLQGHAGRFNLKDSLLDSLRQEGYCFNLQDFSCSRSRRQDRLVANVTDDGKLMSCHGNSVRHREAIMERMCTEGNLTDSKVRAVLTSLLLKSHEREDSADPSPVFSISVLNTRDFRHPAVLDSVLRNVFLSTLKEKDGVVMMLGGVGNPHLIRFDHSVLLQLQTSRPAMMVCSVGNSTAFNHGYARRLNHSLFSMRNVHHFVKQLITKDPRLQSSQKELTVSLDTEDARSCESLGVNPPFMCLCEDQFIRYENDTLMTGFAEFAVGLINTQLLKGLPASGHEERDSHSHCAEVTGESFTTVRVGRYEHRLRILMDLILVDDLSNSRMFRRAVLDVRDTDKVPRAELYLTTQGSLSPVSVSLYPGQSLKTLCRTGESLDIRPTSESRLLQRWSQERHFGRQATVTHVHDNCLFVLARDFGDSVSLELTNVCRDRRYDVTLHVSLMNMISLSPLPLSASLGHAQRGVFAAIVKVSYTVATFAYKLDPDFTVTYD